jgi:hypothetical protein
MAGKAARSALYADQNPEDSGLLSGVEFAGVELRQDVVNIEYDRSPSKFREQGTKDHEVRDGVYVQDVITLVKVRLSNLECGADEKLANSPAVGKLALFVENPGLETMDMHAIYFFLRGLAFTSQRENVHMITASS